MNLSYQYVIGHVKLWFATIWLAYERRRNLQLSPVPAEKNIREPEPRNVFCDVGILSQSLFSSSSPRVTAQGIRCEEHSSFILS